MPHLLKEKTLFSKEQTVHNKKLASLRIHVERIMERIKNWHIFDRRIAISTSALASDILIVVCTKQFCTLGKLSVINRGEVIPTKNYFICCVKGIGAMDFISGHMVKVFTTDN